MMAQILSMINYQFFGIDARILDFFHKMDTLIRTIKLILLFTTLHSKGLERSIGDASAKKRHDLIFFSRF
jgi:hypothetical protein